MSKTTEQSWEEFLQTIQDQISKAKDQIIGKKLFVTTDELGREKYFTIGFVALEGENNTTIVFVGVIKNKAINKNWNRSLPPEDKYVPSDIVSVEKFNLRDVFEGRVRLEYLV